MDLTKEEFEKFIKENEKCAVDFWAPWCGPCKALAPTVEAVCESKSIPLGKVDIDQVQEVAQEYGIMSIPCVILFEGGEEKDRKIGNVSRASLEKFLD